MGLVLAILGVIFVKPVIIISTSVSNGLLAGSSLAMILDQSSIGLVLGIIFAIAGIFVQFATNKGKSTKIALNSSLYVAAAQEHVAEETGSNRTVNAIEEKTSDAFLFIKDSAVKASSTVSSKVKNKIEQDQLTMSQKAKGRNLEDACDNLEEVFYSNRILRNVMPFAEYILYAVAFLAMVSVLPSTFLLLVVGVLCFAKKKHGAIAISFSIVTLSELKRTLDIPIEAYRYLSTSYILTMVIELLLLGYISFVAVTYYFKSKHGVALKNKLANLFSNLKTQMPINKNTTSQPENIKIMIRCSNCGQTNEEGSKFCKDCGQEILKPESMQNP